MGIYVVFVCICAIPLHTYVLIYSCLGLLPIWLGYFVDLIWFEPKLLNSPKILTDIDCNLTTHTYICTLWFCLVTEVKYTCIHPRNFLKTSQIWCNNFWYPIIHLNTWRLIVKLPQHTTMVLRDCLEGSAEMVPTHHLLTYQTKFTTNGPHAISRGKYCGFLNVLAAQRSAKQSASK